jgi:hypothetical protein
LHNIKYNVIIKIGSNPLIKVGAMTVLFIAERLHDSAGSIHPIDRKVLSGTTREELIEDAYTGLKPGYYPSTIYVQGDRDPLWREHGGWTEKADEIIPS